MTNEQIITELHLEDAPDDLKERIIENTRGIVELRVIGIVTDMMTDEQSTEFQTLEAAGDDGAVWAWLRTNVVGVDVSEVYEAALKDYLEEFNAQQAQA